MNKMKLNFRLATFAVALSVAVASASASFAANTPEETLKKLSDEYQIEATKFQNHLDSIKDKKEKEKAEAKDPNEAYAPRFARIMEESPTSPAAIDAAIWIVISKLKNKKLNDEAIRFLFSVPDISDNKLAVAVQLMRRAESSAQNLEYLRNVRAGGHSRDIRGLATLILAEKLKDTSSSEAEALFEDILKNYQDAKNLGTQKGTLTELAGRYLFEIQHLAVGKEAPEIEGTDLNGKKMRLSDYRGKVVLLTFFGDW